MRLGAALRMDRATDRAASRGPKPRYPLDVAFRPSMMAATILRSLGICSIYPSIQRIVSDYSDMILVRARGDYRVEQLGK
ncbi:hypothetical protein D3C72_2116100 [compost metagenome]